MKVWEFVITGGPCGGKTTAINRIKEELNNKGFKVIIVPESATELISSGINPFELEQGKFEAFVISRAVNKEETTREAVKYFNKDTVIIYDRGIMDCKAYMPCDMFEKELKKYNLDENLVLERYDAVFHLVTTAIGAEEFYTLSNNEARTETLEEASVLDEKTKEAWINHKNLKVIDNSTDFEKKLDKLIKEIYIVMGYVY